MTPDESYRACTLCPRSCGVDRTNGRGFCGADDTPEVAKIMLHHWEEPPISGTDPERGSGAIFFSHCSLGCAFCQNRKISRREGTGQRMTAGELADAMRKLEADGAYNINLVSPTHYTPTLTEAVRIARAAGLRLPIVWNTGGYERPETIRQLDGTVDIYLTDFKYASSDLALRYSGAADYPEAAMASLEEMLRQIGACVFDEDGMMRRGVIVRHLVLPGCAADSITVLRQIAGRIPVNSIRLSLMAQYTPDFLPEPTDGTADPYRGIRRKITTYEYDKVADEADRLGFDGWMQERSSATSRFTPDF